MLSEADLESVRAALGPAFHAAAGGSVSPVLVEFGWLELLASDPGPAVATVFELLGRTGATAGALGDAMGLAFASLPWSASTVLLPLPGRASAPPGTFDGAAVSVDGLCLEPPSGGEVVVAAATTGGAVRPVLVAIDRLERAPAAGIDPWVGLVRLTGVAVPLDVDGGSDVVAAARWEAALSWGRLALAAQLTGVVQASLTLAGDHARSRCQFGRAVGTFQAVQHRLADLHVALEAARATVGAAGGSCRRPDAAGQCDPAVAVPDEVAAMVAKSMAGRAASVAAVNALQVLAGIGFTWEHPLHRFQKRGIVLDRLLGGSRDLPAVIGSRLTASGKIPTLVAL